jgi:LCP family protein required for cell wall assembly
MTQRPKVTNSRQEPTRDIVPPRNATLEVRHRWISVPCLLLALSVVVLGSVVGIILYVATHSRAFTGSAIVPRPAGDARPFAWPFGLTRRVNVLLIGVDVTINERRQVLPYSRSDALMLVSFDPQRDRIGMLSIPRDTYMTVPQVGPERINAAYAVGGPRLTIRTVQDLLGVPVQYYVKLGPASFEKVVDAIGGIEIDVEKDMKYTDTWGNLYIDLKKGRQELSGDGASQYIRFRDDNEGDIGRIRRQQKLLLAIIKKLKSPAMTLSLPRVVQAVVTNTQTNLSFSELITLGLFMSRLDLARIQTVTLPGEVGNYVFLDEGQMQQIVAEMFLGVDRQTLGSAGLEVLNGSGIPGLARQLARRLEQLGFRIVRVETAPRLAQITTIIDRAGRPHVAQALAELLGQKPVTHQPGSGADITIVVAHDLATWYPPEVSRQ